jgi:hypothetical protein
MSVPKSPFIKADALYAGKTIHVITVDDSSLTGVTADESTDVISKAAHGMVDGQGVIFVSGTGFTGLTAGTLYYVRDSASGTFKVAADIVNGVIGAAIDITAAGSDGVFQPVEIVESSKIDNQVQQNTFQFRRNDDGGRSRIVDEYITQDDETFVIVLDMAKRLLRLFGGALGGSVSCTVTSYVRSPRDATGTVAMKSEDNWPATLTRNRSETLGGGQGTLPELRLRSNKEGYITWEADADVS